MFVAMAEQVGKSGLSIWKDFLTPLELAEIRADVAVIQGAQGFGRAGTGQGEGNDVRDLVRRDEVHWIDRATDTKAQAILWDKLDSVKQALNRTLFLGLSQFNGHYASYPAGGYYRRHRDCFAQDDSRVVSTVLYLNENWQIADGGQLRVYGVKSYVDIEPIGGTLVCFLSAESEHEVLLNHANRLSFTGWFSR